MKMRRSKPINFPKACVSIDRRDAATRGTEIASARHVQVSGGGDFSVRIAGPEGDAHENRRPGSLPFLRRATDTDTMTPLHWIVLGACAIAVATDVSTRRIPNVLTAALALSALVYHAWSGGWKALAASAAVLVVVMGIGLVVFSLGWLGGGDVKLAAGAAAAFGYPDAVGFLLFTSIGGGVVALLFALGRGRLRETLRSVAAIARPLAYHGTAAVAPTQGLALPYATAIAIGAGAVALSHTAAPFLRLPL